MQAIILAAGMGKRLKKLTAQNTKCMVKVNGVTLIERMLRQLDEQHLSRIVIVVGYEGQKLIDFIATLKVQTPIVFVNNSIYDKTNNIYSLFLAREFLVEEDTLLLESDLIFESSLLEELLNDPRETLALVDKYENWMDGTCVKLTADDEIKSFVPGKEFNFADTDEYYKTVNIYKFSKHFSENLYVPFLEAYSKALGNNEYYEQVLRVIMILDDAEIRAKRLETARTEKNKMLWYEIDDIQDLDIAESIFSDDDHEKVQRIQKRYGGLWRYPQLTDFVYLVNPYFPPKKLLDELKASAEKLVAQYPSGMYVNSLLAAKNFDVEQKNILVGNGSAELIKSLLSFAEGKVGIVKPTFEEYAQRLDEKNIVAFTPQNENFSYSADDLINFFDDKDIKNLVLVNPNNPTGYFLNQSEIFRLLDWTAKKNICLILDESFVDFADEKMTFIVQDFLDKYKNLHVIKSISKSYGVGGLRLGVLASGDEKIISALKKDVAIWNINSFAEFFMQIFEKYKGNYLESLKKFRAESERFQTELAKISGLRILPSSANFVMVEILKDISSADLVKNLLTTHNILAKDLSAKIPNKKYLRFAVRNTQDNDKLLNALRKEFEP